MRPAAGFIITCLMLAGFYVPATLLAAGESTNELVWISLPPQKAQDQPYQRVTWSALPFAMKNTTDEEFTRLRENTGYDPRNFRRAFSMEKKTFLEGEPILIRFAIELDGEGTWTIKDWYYENNRDETFLLLLRDEKGNWIADRYKPQMFANGGGMIVREEFSKDSPEIHWLPLQQYRSLIKPGKYELYCMKCRTNLPRNENGPASPVLSRIPKDVIQRATKQRPLEINGVTDYAHFKIEIVSGTEAERTKMIRDWVQVENNDPLVRTHRCNSNAVWRSWEHCLRNDFLPELWSYYSDWSNYEYDDGVKRPFIQVCLKHEFDRWTFEALSRAEAAKQIPKFIDQLTADDPQTRSTAEFHLRKWCNTSFGHTWTGHRFERPTPDEGREIQKQWRQWWQENEANFQQTRD